MGTKGRLDYVSPAANLISKPLETAGRKAMGAKVLSGTTPARPPDTLHPYVSKERIKRKI